MLEWLGGLLDIFNGPLGVLGAFAVSLIANSIPFMVIPYLALILTYSILTQELTAKLLIGLSSALGATVGKIFIYTMGSLVRVGLSEKTLKNLELFKRMASKSLFLAIFLFASFPLPDDVLYIPVGITKYNIFKYSLAVLLGKTVLTLTVVFYSHLVREHVVEFVYLLPLYVVLTLLLSYVIIKVDWAAVFDTLTSKGVRSGVEELLNQIAAIFKLK